MTSSTGGPPVPPTTDRIRDSLTAELLLHELLDKIPPDALKAIVSALDEALFGETDEGGARRALADLNYANITILALMREVPMTLQLSPLGDVLVGTGAMEDQAPHFFLILRDLQRRSLEVLDRPDSDA